MRRIATLLTALCLWLAAGSVSAAGLDPESLRRDLTEALTGGFSLYLPDGIGYGEITATAEGEAVRVRITKLTMPIQDLPGLLHLGDVAFTVADAGPGRYRVSKVDTSSKASFVNQEGREVGLGNYRLERFSGVWSSALANFLDLDFVASGIEVLVPEANFALALEKVTMTAKSSAGAEGRLDQTTSFQAGPLRALMPLYGTVEIAEIRSDSEFAGMNLAAYRTLAEEMAKVKPAGKGKTPDRKQIAALIERMAEIDIFPERVWERMQLRGLSVVDQNQQPVFRLEEAEVDSAARELRTPLGAGSLGLRYGGLAMESAGGLGNPAFRRLVPHNAGFILSVERFPTQPLWRILLSVLAQQVASGDSPSDSQNLAPLIGSQLLTAIQEAGTVFRLDRFHMDAESGRVSGEGVVTLGAATPSGATGHANFQIVGLDEMIAIAMSGGAGQPNAAGGAMFFMMLKGMARRETAPDGKIVDHFDIELTPDGQILVNGRPAGLMPPPAQ